MPDARCGQETLVSRISALVPEEQLDHWSKWVGSIAWDLIDGGHRLVILRSPAAAPRSAGESVGEQCVPREARVNSAVHFAFL